MNYIIANSVCCCLQCCCKQIFETLYKIIGKIRFVQIMYFIIYCAFFVLLLISFIFLRDWSFFMKYIARGIYCQDSDDFDCITVSLIYRVVTSISIFIILVILIMLVCTNRITHILNQTLFFSKFVLITLIFIGLLQFGNNLYEYLSSIYQYASYIFLVCQAIIMIDLGYLWGIKWAQKYSIQSSACYGTLLIIFTLLMSGASLFLNIYGYVIVSDEHEYMNSLNQVSQCSNLPNILNTIFIVLSVGVQLLNFNKQNSLLTTSFMCCYISFWCFSSIYSSNKCNLNFDSLINQNDKHFSKGDFYLAGTCISIIWLMISTFGSIFGSTNKSQDDNNIEQMRFIELQDQINSIPKNPSLKNQQSGDESIFNDSNKYYWIAWHFFMLTMVIYLSMVLTDWGSGNLITQKYSLNQNAYISKIFMACFTFAVYIWTLIAPRLFPNRNFYFV